MKVQDDFLRHGSVDYIRYRPGAGVTLLRAVEDALLLALHNGATVEFVFNGKKYVADPSKACESVEEFSEVKAQV